MHTLFDGIVTGNHLRGLAYILLYMLKSWLTYKLLVVVVFDDDDNEEKVFKKKLSKPVHPYCLGFILFN